LLLSYQSTDKETRREGGEGKRRRSKREKEKRLGGEKTPLHVQENPPHISLISTEKEHEEMRGRAWAL
jgi:hypothetical protein